MELSKELSHCWKKDFSEKHQTDGPVNVFIKVLSKHVHATDDGQDKGLLFND